MKRLFRPETLFFLLLWLGLMVAFRDRGFYDPGALWHVKVGEIILDRGIPQRLPDQGGDVHAVIVSAPHPVVRVGRWSMIFSENRSPLFGIML